MSVNFSVKYASNPDDVVGYDTSRLRDEFLIEDLFSSGNIHLVYTHYDRFIVGGATPGESPLSLETIEPLKASHFLQRRELGVINIGGEGIVRVDGEDILLGYKEALYIGRGTEEVIFQRVQGEQPLFYLNSAPAHYNFPTKKISRTEAEIVELGEIQASNRRTIRKLIVHSIVDTCQLQMGMTELAEGSIWNTMPPHVHERRMEAYLYFELPDDQVVSHFLGEPQNTRHIWVKNRQAVLSPPWSIHAGAGTSNYTFIWGMAGENLDYSDMDTCQPSELR